MEGIRSGGRGGGRCPTAALSHNFVAFAVPRTRGSTAAPRGAAAAGRAPRPSRAAASRPPKPPKPAAFSERNPDLNPSGTWQEGASGRGKAAVLREPNCPRWENLSVGVKPSNHGLSGGFLLVLGAAGLHAAWQEI